MVKRNKRLNKGAEVAQVSKDQYFRCRNCGWVHFYCPEAPYTLWECYKCKATGFESFERICRVPVEIFGSTIQPINRVKKIKIWTHYRPGEGESGRDYIALTDAIPGGFAFGTTRDNAIKALKQKYTTALRNFLLRAKSTESRDEKIERVLAAVGTLEFRDSVRCGEEVVRPMLTPQNAKAEKIETGLQETREGRAALAKMVVSLFERWKVSVEDQLAMLGLSKSSRIMLGRYKKGEPLSDSRDLLDRVKNLISIDQSLKVLFPENRDLADKWISLPNTDFRGKSPLQVISEEGFIGLLMVRQYLDFERER